MDTAQEREILKEFIETYRDNVCLWDMSSEQYKNRGMKHAAWGRLTLVLQRLDPDANLSTTKKKVENLRSVYFRELKKVRQSQLTATDESDVFVPNLWYFKLISFLDRQDWGPCRADPLQDVKAASDPLQDSAIKRAPESDEESMGSAEPEPETPAPEIPKRKHLNKESTRKIRRKETTDRRPITVPEPNYIKPPKQFQAQGSKTNTNSFGIYVGEQLEQISTFQRHVAEKLISEVLFLAKTNNLNFDSKIETPSKLGYSGTPEFVLSPRKNEDESDDGNNEEGRPRMLLKELLSESTQKL